MQLIQTIKKLIFHKKYNEFCHKKIRAAQELLRNTQNKSLRMELENYINHLKWDQLRAEDESMDLRIQYLVNSDFEYIGWGMYEIPAEDIFCFVKGNKYFNLDDETVEAGEKEIKIVPTYFDQYACEHTAKTIPDAISKYQVAW